MIQNTGSGNHEISSHYNKCEATVEQGYDEKDNITIYEDTYRKYLFTRVELCCIFFLLV